MGARPIHELSKKEGKLECYNSWEWSCLDLNAHIFVVGSVSFLTYSLPSFSYFIFLAFLHVFPRNKQLWSTFPSCPHLLRHIFPPYNLSLVPYFGIFNSDLQTIARLMRLHDQIISIRLWSDFSTKIPPLFLQWWIPYRAYYTLALDISL